MRPFRHPPLAEGGVCVEAVERIEEFLRYVSSLTGSEKSEAQVFCDRLFQAFGHAGYKEAGATLEYKLKKRGGKGTKFPDLVWRPLLLIEMKSRGEPLEKHYRQAFEYWIELVPERPKYVVLCNFDEFWVYDFNYQLDSPVDRIKLGELPDRYTALNFLFPGNPKPLFGNDKVKVTREAADKAAQVFNAVIDRGEDRERAQRFILQCVVAMFSEDFDLLPRDLFTMLLTDCVESKQSPYDVIGGLFQQMASPQAARGGRYKDVRYFNGGLFDTVDPIELSEDECKLLLEASSEHWSSVAPPIFGTLFQSSMDQKRRHALGAHFTHEADIQKIVLPTIVQPWKARIEKADKLGELEGLAKEILEFQVLDPACGSGNFLYVAYRELVNLEMEILRKIHANFGERARRIAGTQSLVSTTQFHGIDIDPFAVELAKVTLMIGKRVAVAETRDSEFASQQDLPLEFEEALPLDNLDENIRADDALFCDWPTADAVIGNPPYQSKNKMQEEYGRAYLNRLRDRYPEVPGRADYCVYWFRRAHDELQKDARAGLVGTNSIRQNYSREGGLDYIVDHGGTITQAVSTQVWSGDAAVHVSIVNWLKGEQSGQKKLFKQLGDDIDSPWEVSELDRIGAALSGHFDVTQAKTLKTNAESATTYQGQTHGHEAFLLDIEAGSSLLSRSAPAAEVVFPYLTADELLRTVPPAPQRFVIDFFPKDVIEARLYKEPFGQVEERVLPTRKEAADREEKRNNEALADNSKARVNRHHANFLRKWWQLSYPRSEMLEKLSAIRRYIVCARVTKRPVFAFVCSSVRPNDALQVFALEDDYSFGILQSSIHWEWFTERCSTLTERFRYTSNTVYDSFAWPQKPTIEAVRKVATASRELRDLRQSLIGEHGLSLRSLYRSLEQPGENPLRAAHAKLDDAVRAAYGMTRKNVILDFLFQLNQELAEMEKQGETIVGPGLPPCVKDSSEFITEDCFPLDDG